jgi:sugar O-acyltransferase (sialic acid O-acetyltransferase NeuD family)
MSKPKIILIGAGGHAYSCIDAIEQHGVFQIAGLVGLPDQKFTQHLGYRVIATDNELPELVKAYQYALITIGQIKTAEHRRRLYQKALQLGFQLPIIIAPSAHISPHASLGAGTIVLNGAIINAGTNIGNNCIINSRALIEHQSSIEDHCHISTGAILNGNVVVGSGSFIGSGCILKEGVVIGEDCIVGMGLAVRSNLIDNEFIAGYGSA